MLYSNDFTVYVLFVLIIFHIAIADNIKVPSQYYYNGHNPPSRQYHQNIQQQESRFSRGIPVELAMRLSSIQNERELFDQFIENGDQLVRSNRRSDSDSGHGNVRVGRVTDARHFNAKAFSDIDPQTTSISESDANPRIRRLNNGGVTNRFGGSTSDLDTTYVQRSISTPVILNPKPATCMPEQRTVNLRDSDDPTLYYYPSCTRVDRCGGCCLHDLLSCQPKSFEYLNYSVHVSKYTGKPKLEYRGTKIITVEKHTKCKCECKIKAKDCTAQQKYEEDDCRCVCTNKDEEAACSNENKNKLWNPATCSCQCREIHECPSGYTFNPAVCRCELNQKTNILPAYAFDSNRYTAYPSF